MFNVKISETLRNKGFSFMRLIILAACFMIYAACTTSEKIDEGNGITLKNWHWKVSFHELGRDYTILYYRGKKICPNIDFYFLSPNKKFILYSHEVKYNNKRLEVYDIEKDEIKVFKHIILYLSAPDKVEWGREKITLDDDIILYLDEEILEMKIENLRKFYYNYLLFQIDQLYEKINSSDRNQIKELCKLYLGKRLTEQELMTGKGITSESWQKLGDTMYSVINIFRDKYKDKLVFQVFERSFLEHFKIEKGKVTFIWEKTKPRKRKDYPEFSIKDAGKLKD